jgi:hypothetical protein
MIGAVGRDPQADEFVEERHVQEALERACAGGALAASKMGAQPSLPTATEIDAVLAYGRGMPLPIRRRPGRR